MHLVTMAIHRPRWSIVAKSIEVLHPSFTAIDEGFLPFRLNISFCVLSRDLLGLKCSFIQLKSDVPLPKLYHYSRVIAGAGNSIH